MLFGNYLKIAGIGIFHIEKFKKRGEGEKDGERERAGDEPHAISRPGLDPDWNTPTLKKKKLRCIGKILRCIRYLLCF